MAKKKNKKKNKSKSITRELMNIESLTDHSIKLLNGDELVFFMIEPQNLSVMSKENITSKVFALTNVLKGLAEIEMLCLNSRDNFEENKIFLRKRMEEEENHHVIELLKKDLIHLDKIQVQTATARSFALIARVKLNNQAEVFPLIRRIEKTIKLQNLTIKRANKEEMKNMLAVYFEQNVTTSKFEDVDGERWFKYAEI